MKRPFNPHVFRAHGIRGVAGVDLSEEFFLDVGQALAAEVAGAPVAVATDHRLSGPALAAALVEGLLRGGCDVRDLGVATKGLAVFGAERLRRPLAYVSASHLPPEWNGIKFLHPGGLTYDREACERIRARFMAGAVPAAARGRLARGVYLADYLAHLAARVAPAAAPLRILLDCGNGTAGLTAPTLFARLGFQTTVLFGEPDGAMPNRTSEPTAEALREAAARMPGHDLGIAFDGDADRLVFLDARGEIVGPERFAVVMLRQLVKSGPGPIVVNSMCGGTIEALAARFGCALRRVPPGTPYLVAEARRLGAVLGMEASGHMIVPAVTAFDDAVAVAVYGAWALSRAVADEGLGLAAQLAEVPPRYRERRTMRVADDAKLELLRRLRVLVARDGWRIEELGGLRATGPDGWVLVRASDTEPAVRVVAESESAEGLKRLTECFGAYLADKTAKEMQL